MVLAPIQAAGSMRTRMTTCPASLAALLHFLSHFQPFRPCAGHPIAIGENSEKRRIILFVDPIGADYWK